MEDTAPTGTRGQAPVDAHSEALAMARMTDDILNLSRLDRHGMVLSMTSLDSVVENALDPSLICRTGDRMRIGR